MSLRIIPAKSTPSTVGDMDCPNNGVRLTQAELQRHDLSSAGTQSSFSATTTCGNDGNFSQLWANDFEDAVSECSYAETISCESGDSNDSGDSGSVWAGFDHFSFYHSKHSPVLSQTNSFNYIKKMLMAELRLEVMLRKGIIRRNPHQAFGTHWLAQREIHPAPPFGIHAGILADDMGLGKTIQIISLMCANIRTSSLIVVPLALIYQWQSEINKFSDLSTLIYHGSARNTIPLSALKSTDVIITTYGEISRPGSDIRQVSWDRVIFDEAHHLRNSNTRKAAAARSLHTSFTWMITGTPINNSMKDLISLLRICKVPESVLVRDDLPTEVAPQFILLRSKKQAGIVLPPLKNTRIIVPWATRAEKKLAVDVHSSLSMCDSSGHNARFTASSPLAALINSRQSCVLPALMVKRFKKDIEAGNIKNPEDILEAIYSGNSKINAVAQFILSRKAMSRSAIVFCHFKFEMEILSALLSDTLSVLSFHGGIAQSMRRNILNQTPDVLIVQIQTGCEGLNLQQFQDVLFVSPSWNPAVHDQAIARAYRIGQKKDVNVFSFIMESCFDTIDCSIDYYISNSQDAKRNLARSVLDLC